MFLSMAVMYWVVYNQRKGMWLKMFPDDNEMVILAIKQMCYDKKIDFNLTGPGKRQFSPIKYVETFELPHYNMMIRVQKQM